jgi:hypothetical protein
MRSQTKEFKISTVMMLWSEFAKLGRTDSLSGPNLAVGDLPHVVGNRFRLAIIQKKEIE